MFFSRLLFSFHAIQSTNIARVIVCSVLFLAKLRFLNSYWIVLDWSRCWFLFSLRHFLSISFIRRNFFLFFFPSDSQCYLFQGKTMQTMNKINFRDEFSCKQRERVGERCTIRINYSYSNIRCLWRRRQRFMPHTFVLLISQLNRLVWEIQLINVRGCRCFCFDIRFRLLLCHYYRLFIHLCGCGMCMLFVVFNILLMFNYTHTLRYFWYRDKIELKKYSIALNKTRQIPHEPW